MFNPQIRLKIWHLWHFTLKTPGSAWPGKGSIGAKLHSGSKMTRKLVSFLQTWQIMGSDWLNSGSHSSSSWLISGSLLTRNGVWPQWTLSGSISDPGVFRVLSFLEESPRPSSPTHPPPLNLIFAPTALAICWGSCPLPLQILHPMHPAYSQ